MEQWDRLCVADRENMRVVCTRAGLYSRMNEPNSALTIQEPDLGRVFAVAAKGKLYNYYRRISLNMYVISVDKSILCIT